MSASDQQRLREIFARVLGISEATAPHASVDSVESWDSLAHIALVMAVEQEFELSFSANIIPELVTFDRMRAEIEAQSVSA